MKITHKLFSFKLVLIATVLTLFSLSCSGEEGEDVTVQFKVTTIPGMRADKIYISGNHSQLGDWAPNIVKMNKINDSLWEKSITVKRGFELRYKFTGGTWLQEAADTTGNIYDDFSVKVLNDTVLSFSLQRWLTEVKEGMFIINNSTFNNIYRTVYLFDDWKYSPNYYEGWQLPGFNDSAWQITVTSFYQSYRQDIDWKGRGYFRFGLYVDSTLFNTPLAVRMNHLGASKLYFNGDLVEEYGKTGTSAADYIPQDNRDWRFIILKDTAYQTIAVEFVNYEKEDYQKIGFSPGFSVVLGEINSIFVRIRQNTAEIYTLQMIFTSTPLILAFLHLFLFIFYPKGIENLYNFFCLISVAGISFFTIQRMLSTEPSEIILFYRLGNFFTISAIYSGFLINRALVNNDISKRIYFYTIFAIILVIFGWVQPVSDWFLAGVFLYFGLMVFEVVYIIVKLKTIRTKGNWFIGSGIFIASIFILLQLLIDLNIIPNLLQFEFYYAFAVLSFVISMSLFLSYNFANTSKKLEMQLETVKILSEEKLLQQKIAAEKDFEAKLLEAENLKKTKELEDAKELQLLMLPDKMPGSNIFTFKPVMITASEVGGDYYDWIKTGDNKDLIAFGDATDHGLKAGIVVTAVKSLFYAVNPDSPLHDILGVINLALKKMRLSKMTMGMHLLLLEVNKVSISTAGMPPILIFRSKTATVDEIITKSMPLGAFASFKYSTATYEIEKDDIILLFTDGLSELFNTNLKLFGTPRVKEFLLANHALNCEEFMDKLKIEISLWRQDEPLRDDISVLYIKKNG